MLRNRPFNLDNSFIKLFARCANIFIYVNPQPAMLDPKPATYTGNWFRLPLSNTSQAGWRRRWKGWSRRLLRFRCRQAGTLDRQFRIARRRRGVRRRRGIRRRTLTEGYNYTQGSQGNLLFFHYKSQEDKDLQERKGGLSAVSFSEKSSLPLPK